MELEIKGKEKAGFEERVHRDDEWQEEKRKTKREILHFKQPCFTFAVSTLAPGDYVIPFSFNLPAGIPSSIFYKNKHVSEKPKMKVKYHIKGILHGHYNHHPMTHK